MGRTDAKNPSTWDWVGGLNCTGWGLRCVCWVVSGRPCPLLAFLLLWHPDAHVKLHLA